MLSRQGEELRQEFMEKGEVCARIIDLFQLVSNSHRFKIVCVLTHGDFNVSEIAEILDTDKLSNLSQQLKVLRLAGVVSTRRQDKNIIYSLADENLRKIVKFLKETYSLEFEKS